MKITRTDLLTWEPLTVTVKTSPADINTADSIQDFCRDWFRRRQSLGACDCKASWIKFSRDHARWPDFVRFQAQWMCKKCTGRLAAELEKRFSNVEGFQIGVPPDELVVPVQEYIQVPAQTIVLEDRRQYTVEAFSITRRPITIRAFERFKKATGYVTLAEQDGSSETFRDNQALSGAKGPTRQEMPALFLSYVDVQAFCEFAQVRLPTEVEWVAAAVKDFRSFSKNELAVYSKLERKYEEAKKSLILAGWEFTATKSGKLVVARSGPRYLLAPDWRSKRVLSRNRKLLNPLHYDILTVYRTVML